MEKFQNELRNLSILYKITVSIFSIKDIDKLFNFVLEEALELSSSEIAILWFYENTSNTLVIKRQIGMKEDTQLKYTVNDSSSFIWKSYSENILKNISIGSEINNSSIPFIKDYDINSCLSVPFYVENKKIGVFLFSKADKVPYDIDDERILTILVKDCSVCYENLLVRDNLSSKLDDLEKLNKFMVEREMKMIELKNTVAELTLKLENK